MWELNVKEEEGELFKVKNYKHDGELSTMKYGDDYVKELIHPEEVTHKQSKEDTLHIIIKEVN